MSTPADKASEFPAEPLQALLAKIHDPHLDLDLASADVVREAALENGQARLRLELGYPGGDWAKELTEQLRNGLLEIPGVKEAEVAVAPGIVGHVVQQGAAALPGVKNLIAVASGKGGVGKSTIAVNLALALQAEGAKTGILDADVYGPSQPRMLGCHGRPDSIDGKRVIPKRSYGLQSMSIGYLVEEETPMIWRGPMATSALEQMLRDTAWEDLDYLVVDLPPGTGDIQLTLCQKIPVSGAIIVTTPQDISLMDARKALKMFERVKVHILGIVENMSVYVCSQCGRQEHIFGDGGGAALARSSEVPLLARLPLDPAIREGVDNGRPTVALQPATETAKAFRELARRAGARLALRGRDYSSRFPKIVIENS